MNRMFVVGLGLVAILLGAFSLSRLTPPSVSGGGVGLKTESPQLEASKTQGFSTSSTISLRIGQGPSRSIGPSGAKSPVNSSRSNLGQIGQATTTWMEFNNQRFHLLVADQPEEWAQGLMGYTQSDLTQGKLRGFDGMAFMFPKAESRTFWNKDTHLNLLLIWLRGTDIIGVTPLPSIDKTGKVKTAASPGVVDRVVELIVR